MTLESLSPNKKRVNKNKKKRKSNVKVSKLEEQFRISDESPIKKQKKDKSTLDLNQNKSTNKKYVLRKSVWI